MNRDARRGATGRGRAVLAAAALLAGACDAGKTLYIGGDAAAIACGAPPGAPPPALGLAAFYTRYLDANGIPVLSSDAVSSVALSESCLVVAHMLNARADVRQAMIARNMRVTVIGQREVTTDIPEYADLYAAFPGQDWNALRGIGATLARPVSSVGEENVLCLAGDPFHGENILVQTFATAVLLGVQDVDATFQMRLSRAYQEAMAAGLWQSTFAAQNTIEYYAVGVQDWFDAGGEAEPPDGVHNQINTRPELEAYDPALTALVRETMPNDTWRPRCP